MSGQDYQLSTGLTDLDELIQGLRPGDSVLWRIDSVKDYLPFTAPYCAFAIKHKQKLVYFRFAEHEPLAGPHEGIDVHELFPERGFDAVIAQLHHVMDESPPGTLYLFDCLSGLAANWQSDRMLGNFFILASQHIAKHEAVAYFSILRDYHSFHALDPVQAATQLLISVYRHENKLYLQTIKAERRYSNTLYTLHVQTDEGFIPVTQSGVITEILSSIEWSRLGASAYTLGFWSRTFAEAEKVQRNIEQGTESPEIGRVYFHKLLHMLISHDPKVLRLAEKYLSLKDLLDIRKRMIGTGRIGGKAVGMLLARAVLKAESPRWKQLLEKHDSFYVGSDVFYTYLVSNGYWWLLKEHQSDFENSETLESVRQEMLNGLFPDSVVKQFSDMLDYFGQAPIIVRSSSLLEDNFGNAFAGKYESVFCVNQGEPNERLRDFINAVRTIYTSVISKEALAYRMQRKLLDRDEQMGLLIQRVSGSTEGKFHYPHAAGVGLSFNPYVWHKDIDPEVGMIRLVFGLGTRAVDRSDDDYTRVVALNAPERRPETNIDKVREYAQRKVDVLDLEENNLVTRSFMETVGDNPQLPLQYYASKDKALERVLSKKPIAGLFPWVLTFDRLLSETPFVENMREAMGILQKAYEYPVDIEFTANFFEEDCCKINLVQCRPLQVWGAGEATKPPEELSEQDIWFKTDGPVIGRSRVTMLRWLIYVSPDEYGKLPMQQRHAVARAIGQLTNHNEMRSGPIILLGPGRWGTQSPELGVPVKFAEIQNTTVLCEIVSMHENLVPDVSLGTHFFNELVESGMLYLAIFPQKEETTLKERFLSTKLTNCFSNVLPSEEALSRIIHVYDLTQLPETTSLSLNADTRNQKVVCYIDRASQLKSC